MVQTPQKNRKTRLELFYSDELWHHGVMGMSWGERNGPPYPLGGLDKKVARAEAKRKKARERALEKARKAAKKKRKAEARDARREERAARQEEKDQILKEKLLRKGDLKDIQKHKSLFTTQELLDAVNRARILEEVKRSNEKPKKVKEEKPKKSAQEIMNDITRLAQTVNQVGTAAITTKNFVDGIIKMNRDKELHELAIEAKELTNLSLAKKAFDAGVEPRAEYFRTANRILPGVTSNDKEDSKPSKSGDTKKTVTRDTKVKDLPDGLQDAIDDFLKENGPKTGNTADARIRKGLFGLKTTDLSDYISDSYASDKNARYSKVATSIIKEATNGTSEKPWYTKKFGRVTDASTIIPGGKNADALSKPWTSGGAKVDVTPEWLAGQISGLTGIDLLKKSNSGVTSSKTKKQEKTATTERVLLPIPTIARQLDYMRETGTGNSFLKMEKNPGTIWSSNMASSYNFGTFFSDGLRSVPVSKAKSNLNSETSNFNADALLKSIGSVKYSDLFKKE